MKILVAEDDPDMRKILKLYLEKEGYQVDAVSNGREAVDRLADAPADLALLDWMMPVQDGIETCRIIRQLNMPVKILLLTAKGQTRDEIAGLSSGADDYLRKPFDIQVLLLRIKKLCGADHILQCGGLSLNQDTMEVMRGAQPVTLTKTEFELLKYFMCNQRMVLSRELLLDRIWGADFEGDARTVDTHIKRLRKKIGDSYIRTRVGMGYIMGDTNG